MPHDVFISYSHHDKSAADAVCAKLEQHGIRCWIAPRDVEPGTEWAGSIIHAISKTKIMVLVFSKNANDSPQIRKEVERAVNKGVIVVPLRIEDVVPTESLEYFMSNVHWLDALTPPLAQHLDHLAGTVKAILDRTVIRDEPMPHAVAVSDAKRAEPTLEKSAPQSVNSSSQKTSAKRPARQLRVFAAATLLILLSVVGYFVWKSTLPPHFVEDRKLDGNLDKVQSIAFSSDGRWLASGHMDSSIIIWDVASGARFRTLTGHSRYITSVAFSPDGKILASSSDDETVKLWDPNTGALLRTLVGNNSSVRCVAFSLDGKLLASSSGDGNITLWDPVSGAVVRNLKDASTDAVYSGVASAVQSTGSNVFTGEPIRRPKPMLIQSAYGSVDSIAFSPDGRSLASGWSNGNAVLWDVTTGHPTHIMKHHSSKITSLEYSPDGRFLASGSADQTIVLWDSSGNLVRILNNHTALIVSVAFSPDSRWLASAVTDRTVQLWQVETGRYVVTLWGHTDSPQSVAFSPDGKLIASGGNDRTIILWRRTN
jgi:WD40 repeat protein